MALTNDDLLLKIREIIKAEVGNRLDGMEDRQDKMDQRLMDVQETVVKMHKLLEKEYPILYGQIRRNKEAIELIKSTVGMVG